MSKRRLRASSFGDNPHIRRRYGEASKVNIRQPWERRYRGIKVAKTRVSPHIRHFKGHRIRVKGHIRKLF